MLYCQYCFNLMQSQKTLMKANMWRVGSVDVNWSWKSHPVLLHLHYFVAKTWWKTEMRKKEHVSKNREFLVLTSKKRVLIAEFLGGFVAACTWNFQHLVVIWKNAYWLSLVGWDRKIFGSWLWSTDQVQWSPSVRPGAKYFLVWPSHSVNKDILWHFES